MNKRRYPMIYQVSMLNWFYGKGPQPTHDSNGYYIPYINSLPIGWYLFYRLTGLIPFSIKHFIFHPRAWMHVPWGVYCRIRRRLERSEQ